MTNTAARACQIITFSVLAGVCDRPVLLAQTRFPVRGPLFGGDAESGALHRTVDLRMSMAQGADDDLGADAGTGGSPLEEQIGGRYSDVSALLRLAVTRPRFVFETVAGAAARRYPELDSFVGSSDSTRSTMTIALGRKTTLRSSLDATYVSTVSFDTFADRSEHDAGASANLVDAKTLDWTSEQLTFGGAVGLTRMVRKQFSLSLVGASGRTERRSLHQRNDQRAVAALLTKQIGRDSSLTASYTFHQGATWIEGLRSPLWSQDVQLSAERRWRQSKFRSTMIRVSGGPSLLRQRLTVFSSSSDSSLPPSADTSTERLLSLVGSVTLAQEMRGWNVQGWYRRGAGVRDAVFFSNTAGLDVVTRFGRRLSLSGSAGYTDGDVGLGTPVRSRYGTAFGSARLQLALARFVAVQSQYFLYQYEYGSDAIVPEGARRRSNRRGLRVGLVFWAPVSRG